MDSAQMKTSFKRYARGTIFIAMGVALFDALPAQAQERGFAIHRLDASDRGSDWFTTESLDLRGHLRGAAGFVNDGAYRPLAIYNADGSVRSSIVHDQIVTQLGGALILQDRFRLSMSLPIIFYQGGSGGALQGQTYEPPRNQSVGDLRIGGDARMLGKYGEPFTMALGLRVFAPTGSRRDYTGDGSVRIHPRVLVAGDIDAFAYSAHLGFQYRPLDESMGGSTLGSELTFGAAAGARLLDRALILGPEVYAGTVVVGPSALSRTLTHVDILAGLHYTTGQVRLGTGIGTGLVSGFGSASARWALSLEWHAEPPAAPTVAHR
jgi:hypothetical protein